MNKSKNFKISTGKIWDNAEDNKLNKLENFTKSAAASVDEYQSQLEKMQLFDLQKHATEVGEAPRDNRDSLIGCLVKKFKESSS